MSKTPLYRVFYHKKSSFDVLTLNEISIMMYLHIMQELLFIVTESPDGGLTAHCREHSIHSQAETMEDIKNAIIEAVHCHFDDNEKRNIRLQIIKEEVIAA